MITYKNDIASTDTLKARRFRFLLMPFVLLASSCSFALDLNITAKFSPDPAAPNKNTFTNTTPNSGYCHDHPGFCTSGSYSILLNGLVTETTSITAGHTDRRQGAMFTVPSDWKEVEIKNSEMEISTVKIRIAGFGGQYNISPSASAITGVSGNQASHSALWVDRDWVYAAPPCTYSGMAIASANFYRFFWRTPVSAICGKTAQFDIPAFSFSGLSFMYEMQAPNPLNMKQGAYTGQLTYTIGPGGDFDFGDRVIPSDNTLTLNFSLSVEHLLRVRFPTGADRLTLVPAGGWLQWINRGRRPEKLSANQDFQIWSSASFKMLLQCEHAIGSQCGIQNKDGHSVPVETRVTLPSGLLTETNTPVNRHLLTTVPSNFHPSYYVDNSKATLEFEVGRDSVQEMTEHAGKQYTGDVTVILDLEI